jgi:transcription elongation factor Elf1
MPPKIADLPPDSERIPQEFYCYHCGGYFLANLNMNLNIKIRMKCPNCNNEHARVIKDGVICEEYSAQFDRTEEIMVLKCTYQKEPYTKKMREINGDKHKTNTRGARVGVPLDDLWVQKAAREKGHV